MNSQRQHLFNFSVLLFDVRQVEVLRGPQSTLYGKNALGGIVNIISRRSENSFFDDGSGRPNSVTGTRADGLQAGISLLAAF